MEVSERLIFWMAVCMGQFGILLHRNSTKKISNYKKYCNMKKFLPLVLVCFLSTYVIEAKSFSSKTIPKIFKHFITLIISPQIYKKISRIAFFLR